MIRLAVFDMAGTTVQDDDAVHQALIDAMAHFDLPVTREDANAVMGYPKPYAISKLLEQKQKSLEMVAEIYPVFESLMIEHYQRIQDLRPTYFAEECFDQLQNHDIKIGLDTGFSKAITEVIIKRLGWDHKVDAWVSSDMVEDGRPHPYMIEYLMEHTGVADNNQVAKIGDTMATFLKAEMPMWQWLFL